MSTTTEAVAQPRQPSRPLWRRLVGFNLLSAVLLGVGGYFLFFKPDEQPPNTAPRVFQKATNRDGGPEKTPVS